MLICLFVDILLRGGDKSDDPLGMQIFSILIAKTRNFVNVFGMCLGTINFWVKGGDIFGFLRGQIVCSVKMRRKRIR